MPRLASWSGHMLGKLQRYGSMRAFELPKHETALLKSFSMTDFDELLKLAPGGVIHDKVGGELVAGGGGARRQLSASRRRRRTADCRNCSNARTPLCRVGVGSELRAM